MNAIVEGSLRGQKGRHVRCIPGINLQFPERKFKIFPTGRLVSLKELRHPLAHHFYAVIRLGNVVQISQVAGQID